MKVSPVLYLCRISLAFSWIYQGAVPKIVCKSAGEVDLIKPVAPVYRIACSMITWMGYGEVLFGLLLLLVGARWLFGLNVVVLVLLLGWVALIDPSLFTQPFNPLTLNAALIALSFIAMHEIKKTTP
jgi:DoxX-like family